VAFHFFLHLHRKHASGTTRVFMVLFICVWLKSYAYYAYHGPYDEAACML
jgi:hypothetical protein